MIIRDLCLLFRALAHPAHPISRFFVVEENVILKQIQKAMEPEFKPSSDRAIAWAKAATERKRKEEKRMVEDFKTNPRTQAIVKRLFQKNHFKDGYGNLSA